MVRFHVSEPLSLGAELEFQLLEGQSLNLADGILPLLRLFPEGHHVKPEFLQNTVEIASKVCHSVDELEEHVLDLTRELRTHCERLEMGLCGAGTHPFCRHLGIVTPLPRYLSIEQDYGYLSHSQITFGTHVHVGMTSGDELISTMRALKPYLPLLVALSANSPFFQGHNTGFASYRQRILAATRTYGIPPSFESWRQFCSFFDGTRRAGMIASMNDIHWDIRPRPHLGTLEVRAMDAQATVEEAMGLAGLVLSLVVQLRREPEAEHEEGRLRALPWWIEKDNHFQASRCGMESLYVADEEGTVVPLKQVWRAVAASIRPTAEELGVAGRLDRLCQAVDERRLGYDRQRAVFREWGSMYRTVAALVHELDEESVAHLRPTGEPITQDASQPS